VSVKRVANRLRLSAPRLEHYLRSRGELHDLMLDTVLGRIGAEVTATGADWRADVELLAHDLYRLATEHTWLVELIGARPSTGPAGLRLSERALRDFVDAGAELRDAAMHVDAVLALVCGSVRRQAGRRADDRDDPAVAARYLLATVAADGLDLLAELFSSSTGSSGDESFDSALARLLDGIAARTSAPTDAGSRES
jgi:AcrR family transcriptional regulator